MNYHRLFSGLTLVVSYLGWSLESLFLEKISSIVLRWVSQSRSKLSSFLAPSDPGSFWCRDILRIFWWILTSSFCLENWTPAILRISKHFFKCHMLYTLQRGILCWFQKCLTLYVYLEWFSSYTQKMAVYACFRGTSQKPPFFVNNLRTTEDKHTKLNIFGTSIKSRVEWYAA